jgi:hypothetical protein
MALERWDNKHIVVHPQPDGSFTLGVIFRDCFYYRHYYNYTLSEAVVLFRDYCMREDGRTIRPMSLEEALKISASA